MTDALAAYEARKQASYDVGRTVVYASRSDPRFSYCLYVPRTVGTSDEVPELIVGVHGSGRADFVTYRDDMVEFCRYNNAIVLCPLFPVGVLGDGERNGYKMLIEGDIRYDRVLLAIVEEVGQRYGIAFDRFAMFGHSGGGQFAQRFMMVHPERLWALSASAPGSVTLPDVDRPWWVGVGDMRARFGRPFDLDALRRLAVHLTVGDADLQTWEITHIEGSNSWMTGANDAGKTRVDRLKRLAQALEAVGVSAQLEIVPGAAHDPRRTIDGTKAFLFDTIRNLRRSGGKAARRLS